MAIPRLQAEIDRLKEELAQAQRGNLFLVDLLVQRQRQQQDAAQEARPNAEIASLQAQLNAALQTNVRLQERIIALRNSQTTGSSSGLGSVHADNCASDDVFTPRANNDMNASRNIWGPGLNPFVNNGGVEEPGSPWGSAYPKRSGPIDPYHTDEDEKNIVDWNLPKSAIREQSTPRGTRIIGSDGHPFYVATPSPPPVKDPVEYEEKKRFTRAERSRLASVAVWIEDKAEGELTPYWIDFASKYKGHSADAWRAYYEANVRPLHLQRLEKRESEAKAVPRSGAVLTWVADREAKRKNEQAISNYRREAKSSSYDEEDLIDLETDNGHQFAIAKREDSTMAFFDNAGSGTPLALERTVRRDTMQTVRKRTVTEHEIASRPNSVWFSPAMKHLYDLPPGPTEYPAPPMWYSDRDWKKSISFTHYIPFERGQGFRRTILITNVTRNTTLAEVLDQVHCGRVLSAQYIETAGMKTLPPTQGNTVIVEFYGNDNATRFARVCSQQPISFPDENGNQYHANVTLLPTPTRPIPQYLARGMQDCSLSRIVSVLDARNEMTAQDVMGKYFSAYRMLDGGSSPARYPIRLSEQDGFRRVIRLEFANVEDARKLHRFLHHEPEFRSMTVSFLQDSCTRARV